MTPEEKKRLLHELDTTRSELEDLHDLQETTRNWMYSVHDQLTRVTNRNQNLQTAIEQAQRKKLYQAERVKTVRLQQELLAMHGSWSWKLTLPLRWLVCKIRRIPFRPDLSPELLQGPGPEILIPDPENNGPSPKDQFLQEQIALLDTFLSSGEVLDFVPQEPPKVAVVILLFNRAELTLACLLSLLKHTHQSLELILVDNASTDRTPLLLERVKGAKVVRNEENLHFVKGCNQCLDLVESEYLLFLNNDAEVMEGALEAALRVFEEEEKVGVVGGMIHLMDGTLQEAGSILWNDGSCQGMCRGKAPDVPEANFRRTVDFCSGAFLLTPASLFRSVGGFDTQFSPAYYEEVDYCLQLKAMGYATVYEPTAMIRHFEFGSSLDEADPVALQLRNREKLVEKYREELKEYPERAPGNFLSARTAPPGRPRLLYIDDRVPHPELGSGYPRAHAIVHMLVELGFEVTLIPLNFPLEDTVESARRILPPRVEVVFGCGPLYIRNFMSERKGFYDVLWVSRPNNMRVLTHCLDTEPELLEGLHVVYDAEAVFALRDLARSRISGHPLDQNLFDRKLKKERELLEHVNTVVSVTESECRLLCAEAPHLHQVCLGHMVDVEPTPEPFESRSEVLFVGNLQADGTPNVDSILWFVQEVWPQVREELRDLDLHIIGPTGAEELQGIQGNGVTIHGRVERLEDWYRRSRVFIAPTRFSAGIPLKVVEAAGFGVPSVITGQLAKQLGWQHEEACCVATGEHEVLAQNVADQLVRLYTDPALWQRVREQGLQRIQTGFSLSHLHSAVTDAVKPLA